MKKTIFSKFIATLMTGAVLISSTALGTGSTVSGATTGPTISASSFNASAGQMIEVDVNISGNTGFTAIGMTIDYHSDLIYLGSENTGLIPTLSVNYDQVSSKVAIAGAAGSSNNKNGTIAKLRFEIPSSASVNMVYDFDLDIVQLQNNNTVINAIEDDGAVTVKLKGDVNLDGVVNNTDANLVLTHFTKSMLGISYLPVDVLYLADVDENGDINANDSSYIGEYAQGGKTWEQILGW